MIIGEPDTHLSSFKNRFVHRPSKGQFAPSSISLISGGGRNFKGRSLCYNHLGFSQIILGNIILTTMRLGITYDQPKGKSTRLLLTNPAIGYLTTCVLMVLSLKGYRRDSRRLRNGILCYGSLFA